MSNEGRVMKLLKIDNNCGHFLAESGAYEPVDKLSKDELLRLVELALREDVDFDEFDESTIQNQAHQIIYRSVFDKLSELAGRRQEFTDESERLYLQDYEKYCSELSGDPES